MGNWQQQSISTYPNSSVCVQYLSLCRYNSLEEIVNSQGLFFFCMYRRSRACISNFSLSLSLYRTKKRKRDAAVLGLFKETCWEDEYIYCRWWKKKRKINGNPNIYRKGLGAQHTKVTDCYRTTDESQHLFLSMYRHKWIFLFFFFFLFLFGDQFPRLERKWPESISNKFSYYFFNQL